MMSIFRRGALLFFLLLLPLSVLAAEPEKDYQRAKGEYDRLLASPAKQKLRESWTRVIDRFLTVSSRHSEHPRGAAAAFMAGRAGEGLYKISRRADDARDAAARLEEMARRYPDSPLADDALVLAGSLHEKLGNPGEAWRRYRDAAETHPKGDKASEARQSASRLSRFAPREKDALPVQRDEAPASPSPTPADPSSGPVQLTGVRFWSNPGYTRVVLDLSAPVKFTSNFLKEDGKTPPRLYLDLAQTVPLKGVPETTNVGDGLLRQIRTGRPDLKTVRIVLDLMSFQDYKVFALEDPMRIILDIQGDGKAQLTGDHPELRPAPPPQADGIAKAIARAQEDKAERKTPVPGAPPLRRIVVDAGHGGKDPGAVGPSGVKEKDVTLAMARLVAKRLREEIGCDVVLTRDSDVFIPLEERTAIANRVGADLFISIHANAAPNREAHGIETYYLNFSKNDKAAAVAARENGTSLKRVGDLELILFDLMANSKINESSRLAAEIQRALVDDLGKHYSYVRDLGVRQGPFYVLLGATMPSVLVETAFISHPREETRLMEADYHAKSADAIVKAVRSFAGAQKMIVTR